MGGVIVVLIAQAQEGDNWEIGEGATGTDLQAFKGRSEGEIKAEREEQARQFLEAERQQREEQAGKN